MITNLPRVVTVHGMPMDSAIQTWFTTTRVTTRAVIVTMPTIL